MKKTLFVILILAIFSFLLFADPEYSNIGSDEKIITAYKRAATTGNVPSASELSLRILDSNNREIIDSDYIEMPLNSRNSDYDTFSWVFSGYAYGQIKLKFTFYPMYWEEVAGNEYIPYDVTASHTQSRIGNTTIAVNRVSGATSKIQSEFSTHSFLYADSATTDPASGTISVTNQNKSITFTYNMSTYTKVYNSSGTQINNYSYNVCNYWNRYGQASVKMKITSEGKKVGTSTNFSDGSYYANVVAEIITN